MVIVYDTGPLTADRAFLRASSRALLHECAEGNLRVVVPEVVIEEVVSATDGWLRTAKGSLRKARHNLGEAFEQPPVVPDIDVDELLSRYRSELLATCSNSGVEIIGWDTVDHRELIERDLAHGRPFDESGRGYRDALTWHVLRDLVVDDGETIIFITRDKDFSSEDDAAVLHPSLVAEIGGDTKTVRIVPDLTAAMRTVGEVRDEYRAQLLATVQQRDGEIGGQAMSYLSGLLPPGLQGDLIEARLLEPEVEEVVETWGVWNAIVNAELEFTYSGTLNEAEFNAFLDQPSEAAHYTIEWDWDDEQRYATVNGEGYVNLSFDLTYSPVDDSVEVTMAHATETTSAPQDGAVE